MVVLFLSNFVIKNPVLSILTVSLEAQGFYLQYREAIVVFSCVNCLNRTYPKQNDILHSMISMNIQKKSSQSFDFIGRYDRPGWLSRQV